ncbi:glycerophosphodiester phosphodiesterase [Pacificibacter marinus]|uniref:Glycerophosphoryl diester phosphodiesterase n=1 Tax=Pacificibacter marinus TaxID=658057 RepID=A0A1Y5SE96_9RHOB|nr:glycerophosphodiester phosphodiesterase family protein [Pacificibacter marinus]SEK53134.1 glycerophosphoryl diester phosphodiesterase [Pacificibacter marinus]SLN38730.1 Glycerophosphoryl diester phosphodiesterase [Pacificibacter marinus]
MTDWTQPARPYAIAHRGASAYAPDNTLAAFALASRLGADMWEVDIRVSRDGKVIAFHDKILSDGRKIVDLDYKDILAHTTAELRPCPLLDDVIALAATLGTGIYADIKDNAATLPTLNALKHHEIHHAILGAFDPEAAKILEEADSPYPRSVLVPLGAEPFDYAKGTDVIHLCWERMERPQDTLTPEMFERAFAANQRIAIWHEEDPIRMAAIRTKPVIGICSDRPEMVNPMGKDLPFEVVCHRGANQVAPENTLPALECALAAGFGFIEVDLHITADDEIVVFHDPTLERTTNGFGAVTSQTLAQLRGLDAGGWFSRHFIGTQIPTLGETLELLHKYNAKAYLELKSAPPLPVWQAVQAAGLEDRVFFWSFNTDAIREMRQIAPKAQLMARRQDYPSLATTFADYDPQIIEFTLTEGTDDFAATRADGRRVMVATQKRDTDTLTQVIHAAPDMANIDAPFEIATLIASLRADCHD